MGTIDNITNQLQEAIIELRNVRWSTGSKKKVEEKLVSALTVLKIAGGDSLPHIKQQDALVSINNERRACINGANFQVLSLSIVDQGEQIDNDCINKNGRFRPVKRARTKVLLEIEYDDR